MRGITKRRISTAPDHERDPPLFTSWVQTSKYEIVRKLGEGGDGSVYLVGLTGLYNVQRLFVVKIPNDDRQSIINLKAEIQLLLRLAHPNIAAVHDYGYLDDEMEIPILVLAYGGVSLKQLLRSTERIESGLAVAIALQVCSALAYAHESDIIHRDVKPENILLNRVGLATLIDWGIAKGTHRADETAENKVKGTPSYLAPEQLRGKLLDARTDVWQVGVLLYHMLTGSPPWVVDAETESKDSDPLLIALGTQILNKPHRPLPPEISRQLADVINRCLQKDPANRFANMLELIRALYEVRLVAPYIANIEVGRQACAAEDILTRHHQPNPTATTVPIEPEKREPVKYRPIKLESSIELSESIALDDARHVKSAKVAKARPNKEGPSQSGWDSVDKTQELTSPWMKRASTRVIVASLIATALGAALALSTSAQRESEASAPAALPTPIQQAPTKNSKDAGHVPTESTLLESRSAINTASLAEMPAESLDAALAAPQQTATQDDSTAAGGATDALEATSSSTRANRPRANASLHIVIVPPQAFVSVDGRTPMQSPAKFAGLRAGRHVVRAGLTRDRLTHEEVLVLDPGTTEKRIVLADPFASPVQNQ